MTALSTDRVTTSKGPLRRQDYPIAADAIGFAGAMACIDADGYLVRASATEGLSGVVGVLPRSFNVVVTVTTGAKFKVFAWA